MKAMIRNLALGIAMLAIAVSLFLAFDLAGPGFSTSALTRLVAPTVAPPPGDPIPLQSIAGLNSLNGNVTLDVNGLIDGQRTQGQLNGQLTVSDPKSSKITVSGPLLGPIAAKVGGSMVGLFTPSKVEVYKVPQGAFISVPSLIPICIKPQALNATDTLDATSPRALMTMLTSGDVARGKLVGEETLNGVPVKHYVINGDAFLAAAQKSSDQKLKDFADSLWSAEDADVFLDAKTGYPVAFRG
ncbi:MAG: hypothetical protein ACM30E_04690, partial [Nitrososphaerales archaeon]